MRPSYSGLAAKALLDVQGEAVTINGLLVRAVVIRNVRSDSFGQVARYKLSPDMVSLKVAADAAIFTNAVVVLDDKTYRVSEVSAASFGMVSALCRVQ